MFDYQGNNKRCLIALEYYKLSHYQGNITRCLVGMEYIKVSDPKMNGSLPALWCGYCVLK